MIREIEHGDENLYKSAMAVIFENGFEFRALKDIADFVKKECQVYDKQLSIAKGIIEKACVGKNS